MAREDHQVRVARVRGPDAEGVTGTRRRRALVSGHFTSPLSWRRSAWHTSARRKCADRNGNELARGAQWLRSMIKHVAATVLVGLAVFACSGGPGQGTTGEGTSPLQEQGEITSSAGLTVTATLTAVTLGDDCEQSAGFADCAPAEGESGESRGGCGGACQASNLQLAFAAGAGSGGASIAIVKVTLHDASDGAELDVLQASAPRAWDGTTYAPWDGAIAPSSEVKATFALSSPSWSTMSDGDEWSTYSRKFRLRVTVQIDGRALTLESSVLDREPAVAT